MHIHSQMPAKRSSSSAYPPEIIKAVLDAVANEGIGIPDLSELLKIKPATITAWVSVGGVKSRRTMTDAELDESVNNCLNVGKNAVRDKSGGEINTRLNTPKSYRELTDVQLTFIDVGYELTTPAPKSHSPEELAAFGGVLACVDRQLKYIEQTAQKAETIQEVTASLSAAIALKQLKEAFTDPPMLDNWRDIKLVIDIAREALNMNLKVKEGVQRLGVDVNVLGFNPAKMVEANAKPKKARTIDLDKEAVNMQIEG